MSENPKPSTTCFEAPASWNTRYITASGFVCQITLRADSGKELLEKANAAMNFLTESGCKPYDNSFIKPKYNGNGHKPQNNGSGSSTATTSQPADSPSTNAEAHVCPIHNVEMKRWERDGRTWYSHKTDSGWCTGK
jgi:hypothetical protein